MRRYVVLGLFLAASPAFAAEAHRWCGTSSHGTKDAVRAHEQERERRGVRATSDLAKAEDVGGIAILQDEGELALRRNFLDLQSVGLEFTPSGPNYGLSRVDRPIVPGGTPLTLSDDSHISVALPFSFKYYGTTYTSVFLNSDGNLTFGAGESDSTARSLGRFLSGPPRIAPLFADLDPSIPGSSLTTQADGDAFRVTWTSVPQFGRTDKNTFQVALMRDGRITFAYSAELTTSLEQGVAGIAPGKDRGGFSPVDLSVVAGALSGGALAEGFRESNELDLVAVAKKFYRTHGDAFQQLVIFTSETLLTGRTFAFEINIKNTDLGTGVEVEDRSAAFGSASRLESIVMMDVHSKYFEDAFARINGEETTYSLLGHEVGHRWLARALFRDGAVNSAELLGRQGSHWSFFMDSDGSHDEGNDIVDLGGGRFRTVGASLRYGPLDQYLMGMRRPEEVPPFFVVRTPTGLGDVDPGRDPLTGVEFGGVRKDVTVGDVIAALGARNPAAAALPPFRQAFIYVPVGGPADPAVVAKLDRIRQQWEPYFQSSTSGRRSVDTRLQ